MFGYLAVLLPVLIRARSVHWVWGHSLLGNVFPLFGLVAFTLLWLHIVGPALLPWLSTYIDFERFLKQTSPFIFAFMLLHPLLLIFNVDFSLTTIVSAYEADDVVLGVIGLLFLLTFDIGEMLRKREFIIKHWNKILLISSIGFLLIFFHSLALGSDLQSGFLHYLWIFYGVTGILAILYNYGVKRFLMK